MTRALSCPSAQPEMEGAQVLGVIERGAEGPALAYVNAPVPVTPALLEASGAVPPTHVMRFSAPCAESACTHFSDGACQLARRIARGLEPVVDHLPPCTIRRTCRWYAQEGQPACTRCPQVVTRMEEADPRMLEIAGLPG